MHSRPPHTPFLNRRDDDMVTGTSCELFMLSNWIDGLLTDDLVHFLSTLQSLLPKLDKHKAVTAWMLSFGKRRLSRAHVSSSAMHKHLTLRSRDAATNDRQFWTTGNLTAFVD